MKLTKQKTIEYLIMKNKNKKLFLTIYLFLSY